MKKVSLLLVSIALFGFIALNSCKQATKPAEETEAVEEAVEEVEEVVDTAAAAVEEAVEAPAE